MAAFSSHFERILPQKFLGMPGRLRRTAPFGCHGNMELGGGFEKGKTKKKPWKIIKNHGKTMENHGKSWKNKEKYHKTLEKLWKIIP